MSAQHRATDNTVYIARKDGCACRSVERVEGSATETGLWSKSGAHR